LVCRHWPENIQNTNNKPDQTGTELLDLQRAFETGGQEFIGKCALLFASALELVGVCPRVEFNGANGLLWFTLGLTAGGRDGNHAAKQGS
jgi:hypothetical protein